VSDVIVSGALEPWRDRLREAARVFDIVPVALEIHADSLTPVGAFGRFVGDGPGFLLESVEDGQRFGRFSFLGRHPLGTHVSWPDPSEPDESEGVFEIGGPSRSALSVVEEHLATTRVAALVGVEDSPVPLRSGVVGLFGWDTVRSLERLPPRRSAGSDQPDAALLAIGELVVFDHWRQVLTLVVNVDTRSREDDDHLLEEVEGRLQAMADDLARPAPEYLHLARGRHEMPLAPYTRTVSSAQYRQMVESAKEEIARGEVFQIVLSQRFDLGEIPDPFAVYRTLRQMNPSAYLYYLQFADLRVAGSSPEALVRVRDGRVTTRPIAGSRPRGENDQENLLRAATLREDPKEVAEHIMLVDLGRNDVGRVARYGTVEVEELMTVETFSHIMHLTSQVSGEVRDGLSAVDVLRATFPAGTLSGAPKVRAMQLITEMEPQARGLYGGAVGYFDSRGNFDAAILIRTLVVDRQGRGSVQTGAGIVWDSDPASEDDECLAKAEAVLRAVGGAAT
jgi:anthranilate synthase component 1